MIQFFSREDIVLWAEKQLFKSSIGKMAYVAGGKEGSLEVDAPSIPETMFEDTYPEVDEFEDATLNINFQTLRIPFTEKLGSLTQVPNHLRLYMNP